jgi:CSLREA domain-containing protein
MKNHSSRLILASLALAVTSLACSLDFIREIAESIDVTPTDCAADVFVVTMTTDTNDGMCNTQCTLREAILAANACPGENAIQLGAETYSLRQAGSGDQRGDLDITDNLTVVGVSPAETIVAAGETWNERIFEIAAGATVRISGLTVSGGNLQAENGGGILNLGGLTLERVRLRDNMAFSGGGLYNGGQAWLQEVEAAGNIAVAEFDALRGSTIRPYPDSASPAGCGGGLANAGQAQVNGATFSGNFAAIGAGLCNLPAAALNVTGAQISANGVQLRPAILGGGAANFGALVLQDSQLSGNAARYGGGLYALMPASADASLSLDQVTIDSNQAFSYLGELYGGDGGGVYIRAGTFSIDQSVISGNHAQGRGGGLYFEPGSGCVWSGGYCTGSELGDSYRSAEGTITHASIIRNRAERGDGVGKGGGVASLGIYGSGRYRFENVTISGNQAYERGGAVSARGNGEFTFVNVTIAQNWGRTTSGIDVESFSVFNFKNTLIAGNAPWNCYFEGRPSINSQGFNIETGNLCQLNTRTDRQLSPDAILFAPDLTEDNGQWVHILYPGTEAVNRIPAGECPADDQRAASRPQGDGCDVGAYELLVSPTSLESFPTPVLPQPTPTLTPAPQLPQFTLDKNAFCRKGPGQRYFDITAFQAGQVLDIAGRDEQSSWWLAQIPGSLERCWVSNSVGSQSGDFSALPVEPSAPLPDAPAGFGDASACNPQVKSRDVKLSWKPAANATGYRIYRNGVLLATLPASVTVYVDNVASDKGYTYELEAINAVGVSGRQSTQVAACK